MRFLIVITAAAALATVSLAAPGDDTKAIENTANSYGQGAQHSRIMIKRHKKKKKGGGESYGQGGPAPSGCYWNGTPDFCIPSCDDPYFETKDDPCGDSDCCLTGFKVLCCRN